MAAFLDRVTLRPPRSLIKLWHVPPTGVAQMLYTPEHDPDDEQSIIRALDVMDEGAHEPPEYLLPIFAVDERSFAVVVCAVQGSLDLRPDFGEVLRWHLDDVPADRQAAVLDKDAFLYAESLDEELGARETGLERMGELAVAYERRFTRANERPKSHIVRPMQLACQNVIVGYAGVAHDTNIDGERVELWQTCEAPHLGTHEANRALAAVTLCDAFQNGGTMEIRFDGTPPQRGGRRAYEPHPEGRVPASLRRYARSRGFELGVSDPAALSPAEARELFLAVTPMNDSLRGRVEQAVARGVASPERLCFTLLMPVWRDVELDFLLGCSARVASILSGGADPWQRASRMAEAEACRAAALVGMYFRRLDGRDAAASDEVRSFEDNRQGVGWELIPECGAVLFNGLRDEPLPWSRDGTVPASGFVVVLPRAHPIAADIEMADDLGRWQGCPAVIVSAADSSTPRGASVRVLSAPDRISELDLEIERRLTTARGVRA